MVDAKYIIYIVKYHNNKMITLVIHDIILRMIGIP
jgi:hypothetical protein